MNIKLVLGTCILLLLGPVVASAQDVKLATPPVVPLDGGAKAASASEEEYVVGPEDAIEIEIVGSPDRLRARVKPDGTIQASLIGNVSVAGQTPSQLAKVFAKLLKEGGYFANPVINVELVSYSSRYVTVLGSIGSPGLVPMNRPYRLSEILARVGGVQTGAADYLIVRSDNGAENRYLIKDLATGDSSKDPYAKAGDKIYSPLAEVFYISGQVRAPGTYPVKQNMTLTQAIAQAGGLGESGSDRGAKLSRAGKKSKLNAADKVLPDDIIVINERLF
jgi:polysaccharide biosynthesis/export protein